MVFSRSEYDTTNQCPWRRKGREPWADLVVTETGSLEKASEASFVWTGHLFIERRARNSAEVVALLLTGSGRSFD